MKPLKSKSSEGQKKRKNQLIIGAILIFVMFGSVFGVIVGSFGNKEDSSKIIYNNFKFIKQNNFWTLDIGDFKFIFKNNPNEVQEISTNVTYLNNYYNKPLYLFSENQQASYEIVSNLRPIALRIQNACLNQTDCQGDLPLKTCQDNFIIIKKNNESKIIQQDNCVFIQGPQENLTKISDEFLFHILGVI